MKKKIFVGFLVVTLTVLTAVEVNLNKATSKNQLFLQNVEALAEAAKEAAKEVHTCYQSKDYEVGGAESHFICSETEKTCPSSRTSGVDPDYFHDDYRCFVY